MSEALLHKMFEDTVDNFDALQEMKAEPGLSTNPLMEKMLEAGVKELAASTLQYVELENKIQENNAAIQAAADGVSPWVN